MWKLVLFVSLLCCGSEVSGISCKNKNNEDVDWYILYKLPKLAGIDDGTSYYYIDPTTVNAATSNPGLHKNINHQDGVLAKTLAPYFNLEPGNKDVGYIAYNDQAPSCNALDTYGHSKGFMMSKTSDSGFWLLHSVPKFPYKKESNSFYPGSGIKYGQTFICVTFPYDTFKNIGEHLQHIKAFVFEHHIPNDFHQSLRIAANNQRPDPSTTKVSFDLYKDGRVEFKSFVSKVSKHVKDGDLYVTIADNLHSDVQVQTWGGQRNKSQNYEPDQGKHVSNVDCICIKGKCWKPASDHSKWCVSAKQVQFWTCFADSNRAESQFKRPGGALCINNEEVTKIFKSFIKECSKTDEDEDKEPSTSESKKRSHSNGKVPGETVTKNPRLAQTTSQ